MRVQGAAAQTRLLSSALRDLHVDAQILMRLLGQALQVALTRMIEFLGRLAHHAWHIVELAEARTLLRLNMLEVLLIMRKLIRAILHCLEGLEGARGELLLRLLLSHDIEPLLLTINKFLLSIHKQVLFSLRQEYALMRLLACAQVYR